MPLRVRAVVDAEVLRRRLDHLLGNLERLKRFEGMEKAAFLADPAVHDLAERYLHLAVEACLDIANHFIADRGYEVPATYRDAFAILERHGDVEPGLARRLQGWAGFRNVLVHGYVDIDHGVSYDAVQRDLQDLRNFAAIAAAWL